MKRTTAVAVAAVIVLSAIALAFAADSVSKSDKVVMPPRPSLETMRTDLAPLFEGQSRMGISRNRS